MLPAAMQSKGERPPVAVADGIWTFHHADFATGGLRIGTRSNLLRLADGTLALHSPGPLADAEIASIRGLGAVSMILAPNLMHHLFLPRVVAAFPDARVLASPGVAAKQPSVRVDEVLADATPRGLAGVADMLVLDGSPRLAERVFFVPASQTLIAVDLAFHLHDMTGLTRLAMWINGANDRFAVTRLARTQFIADHAAAGRSVARMLDAWDIRTIVVSHGDVLETGGRAALRAAWAFAM